MGTKLPKNPGFKPGKRVAIIGGGFIGMSLAYFLSQDGIEVILIEKSPELGGLASGFRINGTAVEKYYHHFFRSDIYVQDLIKELGLSGKLNWLPAKMGVFLNGRLYDFSGPIDLLKFSALPFFDRLRCGLVSLYLQRFAKEKEFQGFTTLDWCNKYYGKNATRAFWEPLLKSKFGDDFDKIAMVWFWSRIKDRSTSRPGLFKDEHLGYLEGSMQTLIDALEKALHEQGVKIYKKANVLDFQDGGRIHKLIWRTDAGQVIQEPFSHVVATMPPQQFLEVFNAPAPYIKQWENIEFTGALCLTLVLKQSLQPYYWTSINDPKEPFVALVEHTNFVSRKDFQGDHIIYLGKYLQPTDPLFLKSETEIKNIALTFLRKINPDFNANWVKAVYVNKSTAAQHIVTTGYSVPQYNSGIRNVYLAHFAQIYPNDRGVNNAIRQARDLFKIIKKSN